MQLDQIDKPRRESKIPLYAQIIESFSDAIRKGVLRSGDRLPPQSDLADFLGVSLAPVKQALGELEKQGIIARRQGLGTFVRDITPVREERIHYSRIPWFHREMEERGLRPSAEILLLDLAPGGGDRDVREELRVDENDDVFVLKRVRLADDTPLAIQTAYFSAKLVPNLADRKIGRADSITEILKQEYGLSIAAAQQRRIHQSRSSRIEDGDKSVALASQRRLIGARRRRHVGGCSLAGHVGAARTIHGHSSRVVLERAAKKRAIDQVAPGGIQDRDKGIGHASRAAQLLLVGASGGGIVGRTRKPNQIGLTGCPQRDAVAIVTVATAKKRAVD